MKPDLYALSEKDILKISILFHCLEDAIKELIRSRGSSDEDLTGPDEMAFYEETSRTLLVADERRFPFHDCERDF